MKRLLMLWLLAGPAWAGGEAPFLWQAPGAKATHYFLGSVHMLPESAYPLPPALEQAYAASRALVFESDLAELGGAELQGRMLGAARETRPGGLAARIGAPLYRKLQKHAGRLGMPTPVCESFRAWFCALTLELYALQQAGFDGQRGIDQHFYARARDDGRPTAGLESGAQQLELFTGMSDALSLELLAATLDESTATSQSPDELLRLWRSGDVAALEKVLAQLRRRHAEIYERLLAARNRAWLPQLAARLNGDEPTLVIVGAAHLAGPDGLPALLKAQGFALQPVSSAMDREQTP